MKGFLKDFKAFISRGNVLDLAIGVVVGGAFQKIVSSLVNDIIMPLLGSILNVNLSEASVILVPEVTDSTGAVVTAAVTLNYGSFIQTIIDFLIIALAIFTALRVVTGLARRAEKLRHKVEDLFDNKEETEVKEEVSE